MAKNFTLELWDHGRIAETVGTLTEMLVAQAAFHALVELRPTSHVLLRQGAKVIAEYEPGAGAAD
jgi:ribosomal protein S5